MVFEGKKYAPLLEQADDDSFHHADRHGSRVFVTNNPISRAFVVVAIFSFLGNLVWAFHFHRTSSTAIQNIDKSLYAGLERDVPIPYRDDSIFASHNRSIADAAWDSWIVDPGIVALPHGWVKDKMLPQSQHWPWDKNKGIYLLNGFHNIHCLQLIRQSILEAADGGSPPSGHALEHNLHCIESLRQDTLCQADDTPRYSGYSKKEVSGVMQTRMCRSWDKLEAWARDHTACYRDIGRNVEGFPQIEKYKFCPEGYIFSAKGSPTPPWTTGLGVFRPGDE